MRIDGNYIDTVSTDSIKSTREKFAEETMLFDNMARDRIENGEPVYTMGMTSMTEQDWEDLMKKVDSYIEKARKLNEMQQEKNEKQAKEEDICKRILQLSQNN